MDAWIALARGPLFRIALAVCLLGLAYRAGIALFGIVRSWWRAGDRSMPTGTVARATAAWVVPVRLLRARPWYSLASILFHAGIILVPLFSLGHVALWQDDVPLAWPTLTPLASEALAIVAAVMLAGLLVSRLVSRTARALTTPQDVTVLIVLLCLVATGIFAAHPGVSPLGARGMLLVHLLLADLALVLTPTTKISHCILFPLTQLTFEVGWHFPAESGRHVAIALAKEDEKV